MIVQGDSIMNAQRSMAIGKNLPQPQPLWHQRLLTRPSRHLSHRPPRRRLNLLPLWRQAKWRAVRMSPMPCHS
jgi:hypothetical protein